MLKRGPEACPVGRVPAAEIEVAVIDQLRGIFRQPEIVVGTWRAARAEQDDVTEDEAREALMQLDPLWDELFPAEQARIVQLRAFRWRKMLDDGVHATLEDLAKVRGIAKTYVSRIPPAHAARAGHRGVDPRRASAGGDAARGSAGGISACLGDATPILGASQPLSHIGDRRQSAPPLLRRPY